jgi:hypothetical protein
MTTNYIGTTTSETHIHLQAIVLYGCNFENAYEILGISNLNALVCEQTHVLWVRVFPASSAVTSGHGIINMLHEYQYRFSVKFWAWIVEDIVLGPYLLPYRQAAPRYHDSSKSSSTGAARGCASNCEAVVVVSTRRSYSAPCGKWPALVASMASLVAGSDSGYLPGLSKISQQDCKQLWQHPVSTY